MEQTLGILDLERGSDIWPAPPDGAMDNPSTWLFPTIRETVRGAWVENVVRGDPAMQMAFLEAASRLAERGAAAVTTTCGFTRRYQEALARHLRVPVATSSLLLLPSLLEIHPHGKIAVLTYDSRYLDNTLLALDDAADRSRVVIGGVDDGVYWKNEIAKPPRPTDPAQLESDVWHCFQKLQEQHRDMRAILFECCGFPPTAMRVRERSGLPVYDIVTLCRSIMQAVETGRPVPRQ
jgi:hypothetical protein